MLLPSEFDDSISLTINIKLGGCNKLWRIFFQLCNKIKIKLSLMKFIFLHIFNLIIRKPILLCWCVYIYNFISSPFSSSQWFISGFIQLLNTKMKPLKLINCEKKHIVRILRRKKTKNINIFEYNRLIMDLNLHWNLFICLCFLPFMVHCLRG